jgi:hypothetical protein
MRLVMGYGGKKIGLMVSNEHASLLREIYPAWTLDGFLDPSGYIETVSGQVCEAKALGCAILCEGLEGPTQSNLVLTTFPGADLRCAHFCKPCVSAVIEYAIAECSNSTAIHPKPKPISLLVCGPNVNIPLGAVLFALYNEDDACRSLATKWMDLMLAHAIYYDGVITACCPNHSDNAFLRPDSLPIPCPVEGCEMQFCAECHRWHHRDSLCQVDEMRRCPGCKSPTERTIGCDHMHCHCGQDWCYICEMPFKSDLECYLHIEQVHLVHLIRGGAAYLQEQIALREANPEDAVHE